MKNKEIKSEIMYAVHGSFGFYIGTELTEAEMKKAHLHDMGYTDWSQAEKNGDKIVKVKIVPLDK